MGKKAWVLLVGSYAVKYHNYCFGRYTQNGLEFAESSKGFSGTV